MTKSFVELYIEFKGVNSSCEVFLNDQSLKVHHGGYSTFRVNLTEHLSQKNVLKVEVDNSPNDFVYPQKADFTFYGGIYRNVNFIIVINKCDKISVSGRIAFGFIHSFTPFVQYINFYESYFSFTSNKNLLES